MVSGSERYYLNTVALGVNAHPIQQRAIVENDSTLVVGQSA
jgi:hypothetical protein